MPSQRALRARANAQAVVSGDAPPRDMGRPTPMRFVAVGDPQTCFDKFIGVLETHGLLDHNGWLRRQVGLVSMGDHFDFDVSDNTETSRLAWAAMEGMLILQWLAAHPAEQVVILLGNHDAARVMELSSVDDKTFARARQAAVRARAAAEEDARRFFEQFPQVPTPDLARRDFATFHTSQRQAVQRQLLAGRYVLGAVGQYQGHELLLTHAGVTLRQLGELGLAEDARPEQIAGALNLELARPTESVRADWEQGVNTPLRLEPLHIAGARGEEAGGLLAHRPANPRRPSTGRPPDIAWEFDETRPRRFDPQTLPRGLVQACGHTRPGSSARELTPWTTEQASQARLGQLRTLRVRGETVVYDEGRLSIGAEDAVLFMLDGDMDRSAVGDYQVLEVGIVEVPD